MRQTLSGCHPSQTLSKHPSGNALVLNDLEYFETRGLNVLVFSNWYDGLFSDAKMSGIELIHHEVRTATNGDVRLSPTPGQWDPVPTFLSREVDRENSRIEAFLAYPNYDFKYSIDAKPLADGIVIGLNLERPLPKKLEGRAGLNLEFLPSAYFGKTFIASSQTGSELTGLFPRYPTGPMSRTVEGEVQPGPIATCQTLVLAPEDPERRVTIKSADADLMLYDGRNYAQNGWYVVRSLIPAGKSGRVLEWFIAASTIEGWIRKPVIGHSQAGYHPNQPKVAVIELDRNDAQMETASVLRVTDKGELEAVHTGPAKPWGQYLRYNYLTYDFSAVKQRGSYIIQYGDVRTLPFRIAEDVYEDTWHATLDVFFPVQMDHMEVREAYRIWHGVCHLDDARQAPVNHEHFDLYAQGPTTDTPYQPGEHIPGLNIGGWFDAGDYDIRTQTQYNTVLQLVDIWETFRIERDETTVDQKRRYVEIHAPDGVPDLIQQIEHGTLALIAQHRAVGHAICGIVEPCLQQYTHLGDAASKTDNRIYDPSLAEGESDGFRSGTPDDRWAFTTRSTPLNYGSIAALAAASRVLRGYNDKLADECLSTAIRVWEEEHQHEPHIFKHGNTTGGNLEDEEFRAAVQLLITTGDQKYAKRIEGLWPAIERDLGRSIASALQAIPFMGEAYKQQLRAVAEQYSKLVGGLKKQNPFGVPITGGGWAGAGAVVHFGIVTYMLHKAFPDLVDPEPVFRCVDYILGCHPASDVSLVSGVGAFSKEIAYGSNRADFTFIAGGVVPGILILKPDFPENKLDWPFLWGENEYVVDLGAFYIYLMNAVNDLVNGIAQR
ncbi:MAG: glycoside hydrolase family 9 protein [Bacillota bacterium]